MKKDPVDIFINSIFAYDDYRLFLKDYFTLRKKLKASFTQRYFAQKFGFGSHTICNFVINGKRNLTNKYLDKFVTALELKSAKAEYFEKLVYFNQTSDTNEKDLYYEELQKLRKKVNFKSVSMQQSDYYAKWYYPVLRELAVHADWKNSFDTLASLVYPRITSQEAEDAVTLMLEIGVLVKDGTEFQFQHQKVNDKDIPAYIKKKSRRDTFQTGLDALEAMGPHERFASYATFSADRKAFEDINSMYKEFMEKVSDRLEESKNEEIFQITYELFPVSKNFKK